MKTWTMFVIACVLSMLLFSFGATMLALGNSARLCLFITADALVLFSYASLTYQRRTNSW